VCSSTFVERFRTTNRVSLGSIVLPHTAQATAFGFLKNIGASLRRVCHLRD
jgi:hypothetical protein